MGIQEWCNSDIWLRSSVSLQAWDFFSRLLTFDRIVVGLFFLVVPLIQLKGSKLRVRYSPPERSQRRVSHYLTPGTVFSTLICDYFLGVIYIWDDLTNSQVLE
jgi:hypothetical protein